MGQAAEVYAEQLGTLRLGHPLWFPEPTTAGDVQSGDIGFIDDGSFRRLFNITVPREYPWNASGVPQKFSPLILTDTLRHHDSNYLSPGLYGSQSVKSMEIGPHVSGGIGTISQAGIAYKFECLDQHGALMALNSTAESESITRSRELETYIAKNHGEWLTFVTDTLGVICKSEELICISGWVKTSEWTVAAFIKDSKSHSCAVQGQLGPFATIGCQIQIGVSKEMTVRHHSGPGRSTTRFAAAPGLGRPSATAPTSSTSPNDVGCMLKANNQTISVKYYKVKRRLGRFPKVLKAGAGPHRLPSPERDDDDLSALCGMEIDTDSDTDSSELEGVPSQNSAKSALDIFLDYLLETTDAETAVASHDDLYDLLSSFQWPSDLAAFLRDPLRHVHTTSHESGDIHSIADPSPTSSLSLSVVLPPQSYTSGTSDNIRLSTVLHSVSNLAINAGSDLLPIEAGAEFDVSSHSSHSAHNHSSRFDFSRDGGPFGAFSDDDLAHSHIEPTCPRKPVTEPSSLDPAGLILSPSAQVYSPIQNTAGTRTYPATAWRGTESESLGNLNSSTSQIVRLPVMDSRLTSLSESSLSIQMWASPPLSAGSMPNISRSNQLERMEEEIRYLKHRIRELESANCSATEPVNQLGFEVARSGYGYVHASFSTWGGFPSPADPSTTSTSFEESWRARTEARTRLVCSVNRAGNTLCAWHDSHREHRVYPPRMALPGYLNCGCTHEEALFEESLSRHGVGSYLPGESVRMDPALRNPLLKLLQRRYGYCDGDFEWDPVTGGWYEDEDPAKWEAKAAAGVTSLRRGRGDERR